MHTNNSECNINYTRKFSTAVDGSQVSASGLNTALLNTCVEFARDWLIKKYKHIGITSGASAPEKLVFDLIEQIKKNTEVELKEIEVAKESVSFKLPKPLNQ